MSAPSIATNAGPQPLRDSWTMLRRNLLQMVRYKSLTLMLIAQPLLFLLLFVYVFGGTMGAGLPGGDDRADYLAFILPAIVMITIASVSLSTTYSIALDMEKGIIDRFRAMAIAKSAVLTGRVLGAIIQTVVALVVVLGVALLLGYRSGGTALGWLGVALLVLSMTLALTWLTVGLGLAAPNAETASNTPMPLMFLPFLSSGFVPTDSMPAGLRWFAEYQPFTPMIDTLRAWMSGGSAGSDAAWAVGWCVLIGVLSNLWARRLFTRVQAS
ncbi:ABC transporter permease [Nocardioides gansuensis]|uniref:Transport permease protein n=1 Tax=Nocardioides gansuensis TaxID=2138300 RepID=A0A2T8F8F8_9ACTN|nr:ABC transporter permease [Nocardioides gansuensis]PVG81979.1 ABC transporter permease [Nocardioides gansuensis]